MMHFPFRLLELGPTQTWCKKGNTRSARGFDLRACLGALRRTVCGRLDAGMSGWRENYHTDRVTLGRQKHALLPIRCQFFVLPISLRYFREELGKNRFPSCFKYLSREFFTSRQMLALLFLYKHKKNQIFLKRKRTGLGLKATLI